MLRPVFLSLAFGDFASLVSSLAVESSTTQDSRPTKVRRDERVATIDLGYIRQYGTYDASL